MYGPAQRRAVWCDAVRCHVLRSGAMFSTASRNAAQPAASHCIAWQRIAATHRKESEGIAMQRSASHKRVVGNRNALHTVSHRAAPRSRLQKLTFKTFREPDDSGSQIHGNEHHEDRMQNHDRCIYRVHMSVVCILPEFIQ